MQLLNAAVLPTSSLIGVSRGFGTAQVSVSTSRNENHQVRADIARGKHRKAYTYKVGDQIHGL